MRCLAILLLLPISLHAQSVTELVDAIGQHPLSLPNSTWEPLLLASDAADLRLVRNAFFAKHGHPFSDDSLHAYFAPFPWYQPQREAAPLTWLDEQNVAFVRLLESDTTFANFVRRLHHRTAVADDFRQATIDTATHFLPTSEVNLLRLRNARTGSTANLAMLGSPIWQYRLPPPTVDLDAPVGDLTEDEWSRFFYFDGLYAIEVPGLGARICYVEKPGLTTDQGFAVGDSTEKLQAVYPSLELPNLDTGLLRITYLESTIWQQFIFYQQGRIAAIYLLDGTG